MRGFEENLHNFSLSDFDSKINPLSENCCARNEVIFKFLNLDIEDHVGSDSYNCQDRVVAMI